MKGRLATITGAIALLAGCAVGPNYHRPEVSQPIPESYATSAPTNEWKAATPSSEAPKGEWWRIFGDAELNQLEADASAANQELKGAVARFTQAREFANIARSGLFPHLDASPSYSRSRSSQNSLKGVGGPGATINDFSIPFDLSYEIDLWGRVRRDIEAGRADQQASLADLENIRLSIQAEVAANYFTARALDSEISLLRTNIEVFRKSLELTKNRYAGGIATDLDVAQAETILKNTEAELPRATLDRVKVQHALAVLTGKIASSFVLSERNSTLDAPQVPAGVPSELLERRPDIAASERRMAAANARIGVAKAAFFPTVRVNGLAGLESISAGSLFNASSRVWAVGPSIHVPIFEGGRLRADLRRTQAAYEETVANYRQDVLGAFQQVEDNLSAQELLKQEFTAKQEALNASRRTLRIAENRYKAGLVTYLEVATAQNDELGREREVARIHGERLVTAVALIKSLGGAWRSSDDLASAH
ncbi:MAG TPA: efflux transporter outer membrane subunit [Verrucomicrobiae bacterium]